MAKGKFLDLLCFLGCYRHKVAWLSTHKNNCAEMSTCSAHVRDVLSCEHNLLYFAPRVKISDHREESVNSEIFSRFFIVNTRSLSILHALLSVGLLFLVFLSEEKKFIPDSLRAFVFHSLRRS